MVGLRVGLRYLAGAALLVLMSGHFASADVFTMARFSVTGPAGGNLFTDPFNGNNNTMSGTATAPGVDLTATTTSVQYAVTGSFTESGGKAILDTSNGALQSSPPPLDPLVQQVSARFSNFSFATGSPLGVTGIFDLSKPSTIGALYGIELIDLNLGHNGDIVALRILQTTLGSVINFVNIDLFDSTLTIIDSIALDLTHDQIELNLADNDTTITGSYAYGDGGSFGALTALSGSTAMANDTSKSFSPAFNAFTPVPEPGTLAVFLSGMAGLACLMRRKKSTRRDTPTA